MKYDVCKFVPLRADFLAAMSAGEGQWMKPHRVYLDSLLEQGVIVARGRVIDGAGGYGVSLLQISESQAIDVLSAQNPIVKNGVGHYEHFSMPHLSSRAPAGV